MLIGTASIEKNERLAAMLTKAGIEHNVLNAKNNEREAKIVASAGRQGDPGVTQFYVSVEDDLMRIFGGDKIGAIMNRLKVDDDVPI